MVKKVVGKMKSGREKWLGRWKVVGVFKENRAGERWRVPPAVAAIGRHLRQRSILRVLADGQRLRRAALAADSFRGGALDGTDGLDGADDNQ